MGGRERWTRHLAYKCLISFAGVPPQRQLAGYCKGLHKELAEITVPSGSTVPAVIIEFKQTQEPVSILMSEEAVLALLSLGPI